MTEKKKKKKRKPKFKPWPHCLGNKSAVLLWLELNPRNSLWVFIILNAKLSLFHSLEHDHLCHNNSLSHTDWIWCLLKVV